MYEIPEDFDLDQLVGQTFYSLHVITNLLVLDFGRTSSLVDGKYRDYARIEVEAGIEFRKDDHREQYRQEGIGSGQLRHAAGNLADLLEKTVVAAARESPESVHLTFEDGTAVILLSTGLESFHIHTPGGSITV
jgi:hypothetical protein